MGKNYTIFFGDRLLIISEDEEFCFTGINSVGIRYDNPAQLETLVNDFEESNIVELRIFSEQPKETFKVFKLLNKVIHAAGGLVYNFENKLLLINRLQHWDLPKGKIEKGEDTEQAALREVEEECGISNLELLNVHAKSYHIYWIKSKRVLKVTTWYCMRYAGNETLVPQTEEDIEEAVWVEPERLADYSKTMYLSIKYVLGYKEDFGC